jgi:hypothetical protein
MVVLQEYGGYTVISPIRSPNPFHFAQTCPAVLFDSSAGESY